MPSEDDAYGKKHATAVTVDGTLVEIITRGTFYTQYTSSAVLEVLGLG
jgi:hypothetical protein